MRAPYTLFCFEKMLDEMPPLAPTDLILEIRKKIERLEAQRARQEIADDSLIEHFIKLAPWRWAFKEFENNVLRRLGEEFFLSHLEDELKQWFHAYKSHGGNFLSIARGANANIMINFLAPEERQKIAAASIEAHFMAREAAKQEIAAHMKQEYEQRVLHHEENLKDILAQIQNLEELAKEIKYEPDLAREIISKADEIKKSLAGLNEFKLHELQVARSHYLGRMLERSSASGASE